MEELCSVITRGTAPRYVDRSSVRAIGQRCITNDGFTPVYARPHDENAMAGTLEPANGDVLLNSTGTGTIGRSCTFNTSGRFIVDGHVTLLRPRPGRCDGRWLTAVLRSPWGQRYLETRCYSGSTNQIELSRTSLVAAELAAPDVTEQQAIAEVLDTAESAISKTEQLIAKLVKVRHGLLLALFTRGLDDAGKFRDPEKNPGDFRDSPIGLIPKHWHALPVGELLADVDPAMRSGPFGSVLLKAELVDAGIPLLGIDNVHVEQFVRGFSRFVRPEKAKELSRYRVRPRDVMITIMGTVGRACVVPDDIGEALSSKHTWTITFDQTRVSPELACLQFNYAPWVLQHFRRDEQGGIMSAIRADTLRTTILGVPPPSETKRIAQVLAPASARLVEETALLEKLRLLKTGLAADLLEGRIRCTSHAEGAA